MASKWDEKVGVSRLTNMAATPPPAGPGGPVVNPGDPMDIWLMALQHHACHSIDPELIEDRKDLWAQTWDDPRDAPGWMTLTPDADLRNYEKILVKDLKLDPKALNPFVTLVRRGSLGYSEACRVLHHGLKDKKSGPGASLRFDIGPDGRDRDPAAKSKWFKAASEEALEALDDPHVWTLGPAGTSCRLNKGAKGWSKGKEPQGPGATSTSSSSSNAWASYTGVTVNPAGPCASSSSASPPSFTYRTGFR